MSETSYTALQGKVCVVTLEGAVGTDYRWCLTSVPKELALFGTDRVAEGSDGSDGTYQEHFYFLVKGSEEADAELNFELISISNPTDAAKTSTVKVRVIPADSSDFEPLDAVARAGEVDVGALPDCSDVYGGQDNQQMIKYGYPCGIQDGQNLVKYGYPCGVQDGQNLVKYGYPCGMQDGQNVVKYGYPCSIQDNPVMKYGYPCGLRI